MLNCFFFHLVNSERFVLYCLCGCLTGISVILLAIIIILYIEKHVKIQEDDQSPETDIDYVDTFSQLPVYRYDGRTHNGFYNV
jgi:hypothetical protein